MWFLYAVVASLITGVGQVLVKKGQANLSPLQDNVVAVFVVYLLAGILLWRGVDLNAGVSILGYALVAATMYATFYYIISAGQVSLMISIINTFPVVTIVLAVLFLHEWPNVLQWLAIGMVILGIICLGRETTAMARVLAPNKQWVFWGILGSLAIGIAEFITKVATLHTDGFTFTFFVYVMYAPPIIVFAFFDKKGRRSFRRFASKSSLLYTLIGVGSIELGLLAIALAYQRGLAILVSPVISTHLVITAVLASIFLKEKISTTQKTGVVLVMVGSSLIGIWS